MSGDVCLSPALVLNVSGSQQNRLLSFRYTFRFRGFSLCMIGWVSIGHCLCSFPGFLIFADLKTIAEEYTRDTFGPEI